MLRLLELNKSEVHLAEGVHALVIYYYIMKTTQRLQSTTENALMQRDFELLARVNINNNYNSDMNQLAPLPSYLNQYGALITHEPLVGSLVLNYFLPTTTAMNRCPSIRDENQVPIESLYSLLACRLVDQCDESSQRFNSPLMIQNDFELVQQRTGSRRVPFQLVFSLFDYVINKVPKEWSFIVDMLGLLFKNTDYQAGLVENRVHDWLKGEFNESLLINNQLCTSPAQTPPIMIHRLQRLVSHHGLNNEYEVLTHLMRLSERSARFGAFIVDTVYVARLKSRLEYHDHSLVELLQFRAMFDFDQYGPFADRFMQKLDALIVDCLVVCKDERNLTELCSCLKNPSQQLLLDYFVDKMLTRLWPASERLYDRLAFALKWASFLPMWKLNDQHRDARLSLPLNPQIASGWSHKYTRLVNEFRQTIENIVNAAEKLELVKLIVKHSKSARQFISYVMQNTNWSSIERRLRDIELFEKYRHNLTKFRSFMLKFKPSNLQVFFGHINRLG